MSKRVLLVYHGDDPADDRVFTHLSARGFRVDVRRPFRGDICGEVTDDLAGSVVHGGPYNAYDTERHPFLKEEYRWIGAVLDAGLPFLGICQGAQMLAMQQGAWAGAPGHGQHEFGYYEVAPVPGAEDFLPEPMHMVQAHFHTFDLPAGAQHLARSATYENQAFRLDARTYGVQFHPEQTVAGFRRWQDSPRNAFGAPGAQDRATQDRLAARHDPAQDIWFRGFLDRLFAEGPE